MKWVCLVLCLGAMSEKGKGSGDNFHKVALRVPVFVFCLAAMFGSNWHCQKPLVGAMSGALSGKRLWCQRQLQ